MQQMFVDDLVDIFFIGVGVPDIIGIDDDGRSQGTAPQTAGHICPHAAFMMNTQLLGALFHIIAHTLRVEIAATRLTGGTLIGAKEDMMAIKGHGDNTLTRLGEIQTITVTIAAA